jgi:hypothetical protein
MGKISRDEIISFIENNIKIFHDKRLENLSNLELQKLLERKNPYLFKAKSISTAQDLVKSLLDAHLSSQEEGIFGSFLEELAIFVCNQAYGGKKSTAEGIDLEFEKYQTKYIVSIKSGPNWGNSRQVKKMKDDFKKASKILRTSNKNKINIITVNGCCYGIDDNPDKGDYIKLCGQRFWEFITGDNDFYIDIIEPLGYKAKEKNDAFNAEYSKVINRFTIEFANVYCNTDGAILWNKIIKFNSGTRKNSDLKY